MPLALNSVAVVRALGGAWIFSLLSAMILAWGWTIGRKFRGRRLLPDGVRPEVPWRFGAIVLVLVYYVGLQVALVGTYASVTHVKKGEHFSPRELMCLTSVINAIVIATLPSMLRKTYGKSPWTLWLPSDQAGLDARRGVMTYLLVTPVVYAVNIGALKIWPKKEHPIEEMLKGGLTPTTILLAYVSATVFAPIAEELLFRGVLQSWLARVAGVWPAAAPRTAEIVPPHGPPETRDSLLNAPAESPASDGLAPLEQFDFNTVDDEPNPYAAPATPLWPSKPAPPAANDLAAMPKPLRRAVPIVAAAVLFAIAHATQWPDPVGLFVFAVGVGLVFQRTGSLVGPIVIHSLFNATSTTALILGIFAKE